MSDCHVYFMDGWLSVSPTTISFAKILSKHFDNVYIYAQSTQFKKYVFDEKNIKVFYIYNSFYWKKSDKPKNFAKKVEKLINKKNLLKKDDWFVCIDESSLEPVGRMCEKYNNNIIYLSLELPSAEYYSDEQSEVFSTAKMVLVQDEGRLKSLFKSYRNDLENTKSKIFFLPNDSLKCGEVKKGLTNVVEQFKNIPKDRPVCACVGMVATPVCSLEIAKVFNSVEGVNLLYHDRLKLKLSHKYIKEVYDANRKNLYLSQMVYDFNDLEYVYSPIDIGIACYRATNNDFALIGKASGKLCAYLKYSKPVIVNRLEGLADIVEKYDCGAVIDDVENSQQWQNAVDKIMKNYEYYKNQAHIAYKSEFDFSEMIKPFEDELVASLNM